jgi:hypothetical protein
MHSRGGGEVAVVVVPVVVVPVVVVPVVVVGTVELVVVPAVVPGGGVVGGGSSGGHNQGTSWQSGFSAARATPVGMASAAQMPIARITNALGLGRFTGGLEGS